MPVVLALVPGMDKSNYILITQKFLQIDDSKDDPWEVAKGFLFTVFMNLIPITEYESGLESLAEIRGQLFAGIAQFPHTARVLSSSIQITAGRHLSREPCRQGGGLPEEPGSMFLPRRRPGKRIP